MSQGVVVNTCLPKPAWPPTSNAFDGRGNYSLGLKEQLIFPEIEYDKVEKIRGMDIAFVTTAENDEQARDLLTMMGAPFAK